MDDIFGSAPKAVAQPGTLKRNPLVAAKSRPGDGRDGGSSKKDKSPPKTPRDSSGEKTPKKEKGRDHSGERDKSPAKLASPKTSPAPKRIVPKFGGVKIQLAKAAPQASSGAAPASKAASLGFFGGGEDKKPIIAQPNPRASRLPSDDDDDSSSEDEKEARKPAENSWFGLLGAPRQSALQDKADEPPTKVEEEKQVEQEPKPVSSGFFGGDDKDKQSTKPVTTDSPRPGTTLASPRVASPRAGTTLASPRRNESPEPAVSSWFGGGDDSSSKPQATTIAEDTKPATTSWFGGGEDPVPENSNPQSSSWFGGGDEPVQEAPKSARGAGWFGFGGGEEAESPSKYDENGIPSWMDSLTSPKGRPLSPHMREKIQSVVASFKVCNVDYKALQASPTLTRAFTRTVKDIIAHEGGGGCFPEHVRVELATGTPHVLVRATIVPLEGMSPDKAASLHSSLSNSVNLSAGMAFNLQKIPGIGAVSKGAIRVDGFNVRTNKHPFSPSNFATPERNETPVGSRAEAFAKLESSIIGVQNRLQSWLEEHKKKPETIALATPNPSSPRTGRGAAPLAPIPYDGDETLKFAAGTSPPPALSLSQPPSLLQPPAEPLFSSPVEFYSGQPPSLEQLLGTLHSDPRVEPSYPNDVHLHMPSFVPAYYPGISGCTANCGVAPKSLSRFADAHQELEFSLWGVCQSCQLRVFPTLGGGHLSGSIPTVLHVGGTGPFSELSPLSPIPVAFPDRQAVWSSPYHLFIALHFVEPRWRAVAAAAPLGKTSQALRQLLAIPSMRAGIRTDWERGWALRAMRHVIFLAIDQHPILSQMLAATRNAEIIFSGGEHERFWGAYISSLGATEGENLVGKMLMEKRRILFASGAEANMMDSKKRTNW